MSSPRFAGFLAAATVVVLFLSSSPSSAFAQTSEQLVEMYRKATDCLSRGAFSDAIKLSEEMAKAKPDKEGVLRIRVGAGLEDREFEPRRIAGDACVQLARTADLETRQKLMADALRWYQSSKELGLGKSGDLLAKAAAEKAKVDKELEGASSAVALRQRLEALRGRVSQLLADQTFESAFALLAKEGTSFPGHEKTIDAMKQDVEGSFRRWQESQLEQLRQDLVPLRADRVLANPGPTLERLSRYKIPPDRAAPERLDPAFPWTLRLIRVLDAKDSTTERGEGLAQEGLRLGFPYFRIAQGLVLTVLAAQVKDPGPSSPLLERRKAVDQTEASFAAAVARARDRVQGAVRSGSPALAADLAEWLRVDLADLEQRVLRVRKELPDADAPEAVEACLLLFDSPAVAENAKGEGYFKVERELGLILGRAGSDAHLRAQILAGQTVARSYQLFLSGSSREEVLAQARLILNDALSKDPTILEPWKPKVSPRVRWILEQLHP